MKKILSSPQKDAGFALLLSIIIASVVLAVGVSMLKISVSQLQLSATGRESEIAFQASQSMTECLMYWRYKEPLWFLALPQQQTPGARLNAPPIECFGDSDPIEAYAEVIANSNNSSNGFHIVRYRYMFSAGEPELCRSGNMYLMVPRQSNINHVFPGTSVGEDGDGNKNCRGGSACTIVITQGYNRSCDQINSSIFSIQRELTTEF